MTDIILMTMLIGVIAGLLAGLFGLGGGVVIVPALVWMFSYIQFPAQFIMIMAVATSLATIIFTAIASLYSHHKLGNMIWHKVFKLMPGIFVGAAVGAAVADYVPTDTLKWLFISYLFYVAMRMAWPVTTVVKASTKNWKDYFAGGGIGMLSSLLGIGGGTLTVPYLVSTGVAIRNAVAISSACGFPIALSGALIYVVLGWENSSLPQWSLGYIYLPACCGIALTSVLTAPLGARLASVLPAKKLKRYFSIIIFLIAIKMVLVESVL